VRGVVVLSPSRYSLYTTCITGLLLRRGIQVRAVYVRRLLNLNRLLSEFSRDGFRLFRKIWKKALLRERAYKAEGFDTIVDLMRRENIAPRKVSDFRKQYGIPVVYCRTLNDEIVVEGLKRIRPDVVVFTGGGLIRKDVLMNSGAGVLNCHMGVLPDYRGMDVIEWAILEGRINHVGITIHFMDEGIDTGDIVRSRTIAVQDCESIQQLRDRFEPIMCLEMVEACTSFFQGNLERAPQRLGDGKQYFTMHPRLTRLAEMRLKGFLGRSPASGKAAWGWAGEDRPFGP